MAVIESLCPFGAADTVGELSEAISRPGGAMDIIRRRSPSAGAGTDQKGFFASRQGRRTRIRDRNNPGPAPFQGACRVVTLPAPTLGLRRRLMSLAPPALKEFANSIKAPKAHV